MTKFYSIAAACILIAGSGCVVAQKKPQWISRGTVEEFNVDAAACERDSYQARLGYYREIDANNAQTRYVEHCLKAKGHTLTFIDAY